MGPARFRDYEREHQARIGRVVGPLMILESATGVALVIAPPPGIPAWAPLTGLGMIVFIWLSTAMGAVPRHRVLEQGFDSDALAGLLRANWQRTIAWSVRGLLVLWMLSLSNAGG